LLYLSPKKGISPMSVSCITQGAIYIVATPIGNLGDISQRALETLTHVDIIFAEDTRNSRKLLSHYGIKNKLSSLHQHNEAEKTQYIIGLLNDNLSVALISDAGTPLISDPGYRMVNILSQQGFSIIPIPGASAIITALSIAGLPTERFTFEGFLPSKPSARKACLEQNKQEVRTQVYYESSHRIQASINDFYTVFGAERKIVLARELTKLYEDIFRGTLAQLCEWIAANPMRKKGEFVLMLHGFVVEKKPDEHCISTQTLLTTLLSELPVKQAASIAAKLTGESKNGLYKQALQLNK
jgi:16S rRNA (cytidine1402-2'-O)-methyltransferase